MSFSGLLSRDTHYMKRNRSGVFSSKVAPGLLGENNPEANQKGVHGGCGLSHAPPGHVWSGQTVKKCFPGHDLAGHKTANEC